MLALGLGVALLGCGVMVAAVALPLPIRTAETVHRAGMLVAIIGALLLLAILRAAARA